MTGLIERSSTSSPNCSRLNLQVAFVKAPSGLMVPAEGITADIVESLNVGDVIRGDYRKARNYRFHQKYFKLLDIAYDLFEPQATLTKKGWIQPGKDREEFRKWCIVQAGFYNILGYPDGGVRLRAKSIAFARMDQIDFERLYSATIDMLLQSPYIFDKQWDPVELDRQVNLILNFC